jgi:hypothetical protein
MVGLNYLDNLSFVLFCYNHLITEIPENKKNPLRITNRLYIATNDL